ncbi:AraC family transcriptional regulator [Plantibacter flavus]|uniref:helix-turn-helix domain-containing protein n=1 Tax=Plantibacter flavus TaxID=150123 RepID=UPI003F17950E
MSGHDHLDPDIDLFGTIDDAEETLGQFLVSRARVDATTRFDEHSHQEDQLAWMSSGSMELAVLGDHRQLRREHLAWIPAGLVHEMRFSEPGELICVYADPALRPRGGGWNGARTVAVDDLAGALLLHLVDAEPAGPRRWRCWSLLVDLLSSAARDDEALALPREPRARAIASALIADPADPRGLDEWAAHAGVSPKTIARAFANGTGWSFREWRVRVRLHAAAGMLVRGAAVQDVAPAVGYDSVGGFIGAFRNRFSVTPAVYAARSREDLGGA